MSAAIDVVKQLIDEKKAQKKNNCDPIKQNRKKSVNFISQKIEEIPMRNGLVIRYLYAPIWI